MHSAYWRTRGCKSKTLLSDGIGYGEEIVMNEQEVAEVRTKLDSIRSKSDAHHTRKTG